MPHACVQVWEMFFILLTSLQIFRPVSCIGLPVQYVQNIVGNKKNFKTWSMTSRKSSQRSVNQCIFISFQVGSRRLVWDGFSNDGRVPHRGKHLPARGCLPDDINIHPFIHVESAQDLKTHKHTQPWRHSFSFSSLLLSSFGFPVVSLTLFLHESTAGTTILTPFLAEILFCKHSLKVKKKTTHLFPTMRKVQFVLFCFV